MSKTIIWRRGSEDNAYTPEEIYEYLKAEAEASEGEKVSVYVTTEDGLRGDILVSVTKADVMSSFQYVMHTQWNDLDGGEVEWIFADEITYFAVTITEVDRIEKQRTVRSIIDILKLWYAEGGAFNLGDVLGDIEPGHVASIDINKITYDKKD